MKFSVRRVDLGSLGKMGCLLGTVAAFLPSLLCGLLTAGAANLLWRWLKSWQAASLRFELPLIGEQFLTLDLVEMLRLQRVLSTLETVTAASGVTLVLAVLALALVSGLSLAVIVTLVGLAYNMFASATGGLVLEMKPLAGPQKQKAKDPSGPPGTG
jgi:hypothetical protein